ncbi:MAG: hypothetical protein IIC04_08720 [Proteobacteria bacterium]|nr:hypothetical protein [Pseudomonadota bacterium]
MLTSKQILEQSGISRATLNNYIALGLLPKPLVKKPTTIHGRTRRLGFFPTDVLKTIERVQALKREGFPMAEIASRLASEGNGETAKRKSGASPPASPSPLKSGSLRLTLDAIDQPAYLVNSNFELEWANESAIESLFDGNHEFPGDISERNLFTMFFRGNQIRTVQGGDDILRFHLSVAKKRVPKSSLVPMNKHLENGDLHRLMCLYEETEAVEGASLVRTEANFAPPGSEERWHDIYASFFREGIFFAYSRTDESGNTIAELLARRDIVIRDLLRKRLPYLTLLSVLVADLQNSVKISAELPPEEYFQLINEIWGAMGPKLRKFYATHGKHVGDGMVYYFLPQPDCNYVLNAIRCAFEMKAKIEEISRSWRKRKGWLNDLKLNIGLVEGQEWFGSYQTPNHFEFTALGDTINIAGRLSDFAQSGSIWITKAMLGKLNPDERRLVNYGIRRQNENGNEFLVPTTYSRVSNLLDLDNPKNEKFRDLAALPITEIIDLENPRA